MKTYALLLIAAGSALSATAGPFTFLPIQPCSGCTGAVFAINNAGTIAGAAFDSTGGHAFFGSPGSFTLFDAPGSAGFTEAVSITDTGIVSGAFFKPDGNLQDFVRAANGTISIVPLIPGFGSSNGGNLNNNGLMTGNYASDPSGAGGAFGFIAQGSAVTAPVNYPGAFLTQLHASNDPGLIVGYYQSSRTSPHQSFIRETNGTFQNFAVPGAVATSLYDINNRGDMVGGYQDSIGIDHGFLFRNGQFTTIDYTGPNTTLFALNDLDQVVGASYPVGGFFSGPYSGFVATPTPEPASLTLVSLAMFSGVCARRARARKRIRS